MIILIDNYDSFTFNLSQLIESFGHKCMVVRNDELSLSELISLNPSHLVISPGPGRPEDAGIILSAIEYFSHKIPVLGICLGHQAIAQVFGAKVILAPIPYHGKCSTITHDSTGIFKNLAQNVNVARYHSLIVERETLPETFTVTSSTSDGLVMGIKHTTANVVGLQFHPESYATADGEEMLRNFFVDMAS
jgi:anthranilate synthase/aminodeoxychorismate synthase-like glutamine amidotransferase